MPPTLTVFSPEERALLTLRAWEESGRLQTLNCSPATLANLINHGHVRRVSGMLRLTASGKARAAQVALRATRPETGARANYNPCTLLT